MKRNSLITLFSIIILFGCSQGIKKSNSHDDENILFGHWTHNSGEATNSFGLTAELYLNDDHTFSLTLYSHSYNNEGYYKTVKDTLLLKNSANDITKNLNFIYKFDFNDHKMILNPTTDEFNKKPLLFIGTWFKLNRWNNVMKLDGVY